jgi:hypothetical protein
MRSVHELYEAGRLGYAVWGTVALVEALLERGAHGDDVCFRDLASRYRATAESLGFEAHIDWVTAMIEGEDATSANPPRRGLAPNRIKLSRIGRIIPRRVAGRRAATLRRRGSG